MTFRADSPTVKDVVPSPNHDARTSRIDILLLHYTGMTTEEEALARNGTAFDDITAKRDRSIDLRAGEVAVAVFVAGVGNLDADRARVDVGYALPH